MDSSLGLARSAESSRATLSAVSSESGIALASKAKDSEGIQHSGARLSARERTIVLLMGRGLTNKMIARQLSIAPETVKTHAKSIFWKLTVQNRAQAVYRASELGLILDPDFEYTPSVETDIRATFERVWREPDTRDQSHANPGDDCKTVWLECNGELVGSWSVKVLRVRKSPLGFEMLEFVCPRCKQRHEALPFR